jgi:hypothetical protein
LTRRLAPADPAAATVEECSNATRQLWRWDEVPNTGGAGVLLGAELAAIQYAHGTAAKPSDESRGMCLDNMQRQRGGVGWVSFLTQTLLFVRACVYADTLHL